jgi:hypothetical protein
LKKSRFVNPYLKNGRTAFPETTGKAGVYVVRDGKNVIRYVGYSGTNLYKTMYRHFQSWQDRSQVRVTYPKTGFQVKVFVCTPKQAAALEEVLRRKLKPRDNPQPLPFDWKATAYHVQTEMTAEQIAFSDIDEFLPF